MFIKDSFCMNAQKWYHINVCEKKLLSLCANPVCPWTKTNQDATEKKEVRKEAIASKLQVQTNKMQFKE